MGKALWCFLVSLFLISCFSGTIETDVSLPHDFNFTSQLPTDDSVKVGTVRDCYYPNLKSFNKIDSNSSSSGSGSDLNISNLNDTAIVIGGDSSKITGVSFYILDDSSKVEVPAKDITIDRDGSFHLTPDLDISLLSKFLTGSPIQVCLELSGELGKNFPKIVRNNLTFHVESSFYRGV